VANDTASSMIWWRPSETHPQTGRALELQPSFPTSLKKKSDPLEATRCDIHIVGFSKLVGDLIEWAAGGDAVPRQSRWPIAALVLCISNTALRTSTLLLWAIAITGVVLAAGLMQEFWAL